MALTRNTDSLNRREAVKALRRLNRAARGRKSGANRAPGSAPIRAWLKTRGSINTRNLSAFYNPRSLDALEVAIQEANVREDLSSNGDLLRCIVDALEAARPIAWTGYGRHNIFGTNEPGRDISPSETAAFQAALSRLQVPLWTRVVFLHDQDVTADELRRLMGAARHLTSQDPADQSTRERAFKAVVRLDRRRRHALSRELVSVAIESHLEQYRRAKPRPEADQHLYNAFLTVFTTAEVTRYELSGISSATTLYDVEGLVEQLTILFEALREAAADGRTHNFPFGWASRVIAASAAAIDPQLAATVATEDSLVDHDSLSPYALGMFALYSIIGAMGRLPAQIRPDLFAGFNEPFDFADMAMFHASGGRARFDVGGALPPQLLEKQDQRFPMALWGNGMGSIWSAAAGEEPVHPQVFAALVSRAVRTVFEIVANEVDRLELLDKLFIELLRVREWGEGVANAALPYRLQSADTNGALLIASELANVALSGDTNVAHPTLQPDVASQFIDRFDTIEHYRSGRLFIAAAIVAGTPLPTNRFPSGEIVFDRRRQDPLSSFEERIALGLAATPEAREPLADFAQVARGIGRVVMRAGDAVRGENPLPQDSAFLQSATNLASVSGDPNVRSVAVVSALVTDQVHRVSVLVRDRGVAEAVQTNAAIARTQEAAGRTDLWSWAESHTLPYSELTAGEVAVSVARYELGSVVRLREPTRERPEASTPQVETEHVPLSRALAEATEEALTASREGAPEMVARANQDLVEMASVADSTHLAQLPERTRAAMHRHIAEHELRPAIEVRRTRVVDVVSAAPQQDARRQQHLESFQQATRDIGEGGRGGGPATRNGPGRPGPPSHGGPPPGTPPTGAAFELPRVGDRPGVRVLASPPRMPGAGPGQPRGGQAAGRHGSVVVPERGQPGVTAPETTAAPANATAPTTVTNARPTLTVPGQPSDPTVQVPPASGVAGSPQPAQAPPQPPTPIAKTTQAPEVPDGPGTSGPAEPAGPTR